MPQWDVPGDRQSVSIARMTRMAPLSWDGGSVKSCPSEDRRCSSERVAPGAEVLAGKRIGHWICVYIPASDGAGWEKSDAVALAPHQPSANPLPRD